MKTRPRDLPEMLLIGKKAKEFTLRLRELRLALQDDSRRDSRREAEDVVEDVQEFLDASCGELVGC